MLNLMCNFSLHYNITIFYTDLRQLFKLIGIELCIFQFIPCSEEYTYPGSKENTEFKQCFTLVPPVTQTSPAHAYIFKLMFTNSSIR
jgi:hypothetical protein